MFCITDIGFVCVLPLQGIEGRKGNGVKWAWDFQELQAPLARQVILDEHFKVC